MDEYKPIMCLRPNATTIKPFTTVKFSPSPRKETRYLMATNEDGIVRLWKWDRDTLQFFDIDSPITFSCKFRAKDRLRCSSFNYTGTKFTVAGDDGFVYVFSTIQVKTIHEGITGGGSSGSQQQQQDSQSGGTGAVGRGRRRVASALFPDKSGQVLAQPVVPIGVLEGHMGSVTDLAYSHDGQRILSGCQDGTARIWTFNKDTKEWSSIICK
jgi:WD40 repeat protein